MCYVVLVLAATMGILYDAANSTEQGKANQVQRPGYSAVSVEQSIQANDREISFEVSPMEFSPKEVQENFVKAHDYLLQAILAENENLANVQSDLNLITYIEPLAMKVTWLSSDAETISIYGEVQNYEFEDSEEREVTLTAILTYLDYSCNDELQVIVKEPMLNEQDTFFRHLLKAIKEEDAKTKQDQMLILPTSVAGQKVQYKKIKQSNAWVLLALGMITCVVIFPGMDKDLDGKIKERNMQMQMDYSEIVSKLNILLGAGMSILRAFEKIVKDYEKKLLENGKEKHYAYEEMKQAYYAILAGTSEQEAYENFGKRCNLHEYLKLGSLLEQNVRKGTKGLGRMLEEEAKQAFEQRKNLARKLGEEAGTKMLIPMIIMLAIVMIIVLIPAFSSFGV